jgi:DNA mismatch repair protein MutS
MAIAQALVEYIHNEPRLRCRTLFATHYHELTRLSDSLARLVNLHMAAIEHKGAVVFLHELREGGADRSYGIHVAQIAGIPRAVIARAEELLRTFEQDKRPTRTIAQQPSLFDVAPPPPPPHAVLTKLRQLNPNELTPMAALTLLFGLVDDAKQ